MILGSGIITMSGASARFAAEGFNQPKWMLPARGKTVFYWSVLSCKKYYMSGYKMYFVTCSLDGDNKDFIHSQCEQLGIRHYEIIELNARTKGQAETAMLANEYIKDRNLPIFIHNIDTAIHPECFYKMHDAFEAGIIPCFTGSGTQWSFCKVDQEFKVTAVAEKRPISTWASVGFYWFETWNCYEQAYRGHYDTVKQTETEQYVMPIFNTILDLDLTIRMFPLDNSMVYHLGTPKDYLLFNSIPFNKILD